MNWALLAGSLAGVLGLALIARLLGLGGAALADEAEAVRIAEAELPGFEAVAAVLGDDRQSANVTGTDGRVVQLRRHGAHFVSDNTHSS